MSEINAPIYITLRPVTENAKHCFCSRGRVLLNNLPNGAKNESETNVALASLENWFWSMPGVASSYLCCCLDDYQYFTILLLGWVNIQFKVKRNRPRRGLSCRLRKLWCVPGHITGWKLSGWTRRYPR